MSWQKIVLLAFFGCSALASIYMIGKPREPLRPNQVVLFVLFDAALATAVVFA